MPPKKQQTTSPRTEEELAAEREENEIAAALLAAQEADAQPKESKPKAAVPSDDTVVTKEHKATVDEMNKKLGVKITSVKAGTVSDMQAIATAKGQSVKKFDFSFKNDEPWKDEVDKLEKKFSGMDAATIMETIVKDKKVTTKLPKAKIEVKKPKTAKVKQQVQTDSESESE